MSQYQRLLLIAYHTMYHSPALLRAVALAKTCDAALDIRSFIEPTPMVHLWETMLMKPPIWTIFCSIASR